MSAYGEHLFVNYKPAPVGFSHGFGARLWDTSGREYVDFLAGIATASLGHAHPRLVAALNEQASRYLHISNLFQIPEQEAAAERLVEAARTPHGPALQRVFFCNSGAEANEAAIKLARKVAWRRHGDRPGRAPFEIVVTENGFHGRTLGALAATGTPAYHRGFEPLPGGFVTVPYNDLGAARAAMSERTCAVLVEPIQGEAGVVPGKPEYLRGLDRLCKDRGALLLVDEVQTAMGRLGTSFFAFQALGLEPDAVILAKGLGGGVPVGALLARDELAQALQPGDHGSTFGGNPLAATAVRVVLEVIAEERLPEHVAQVGERLGAGLLELAEQTGRIVEVRGRGLMQAIELDVDAAPVARRCLDLGLVLHAVRPRSLRILPPLVITAQDIDLGLERLGTALAEAEAPSAPSASPKPGGGGA